VEAEAIELLKRIADAQTLDARLWDTADVAAFLKLSEAHTRAHIMTRSDFPAPVDLPGKGKEPIRRYRPVDVRDWAEKWRKG
jgi:hypothetical protein